MQWKTPMDTHKKTREHISTLVDGELSQADQELAFAALNTADGQQTWATYHRIGDVLRAQATPELCDGFGARLAARLAAEPAPGKRAARAAAAAAAGVNGAGGAGGAVRDEAPGEAVAAKSKPAIASVS
jgi:sigma-E factor negative regulatory protein RseA